MKFEVKKLKNGLRYILIPLKNTQTVTAMVLVGTGSEYETKQENGLAHFLEHMCFKGTEKRPTAMHIAHELDSLGASYNAFTSAVYTGYYAKSHKKHGPRILEIISDIYLNSTFPEGEISKEKSVVLQEINMGEDKPASKVTDVLDELLYGDQPAGRPITGTKESVSAFTRDHLVNYHNKHYGPKNTLVIVSGAFNGTKIEEDIKKYFTQMKVKEVVKKPAIKVSQKKPAVKIEYKKTEQSHFYIAFRAFNTFDKRVPAAHTLSTLLGGNMSSRLFSKIREEMGLCYYIYSSYNSGIDDGTFTIKAGVGHDRVEDAIIAILAELKKIKEELVNEQELRKVKDYRLSGLVLGLETSDDYAEYAGFQELIKNKIRTPEEAAERIESVTAKQVQQVAREMFKEEGMNFALIGPHQDEKKFLKLLTFKS